jgi:hydrogenase-4 component E
MPHPVIHPLLQNLNALSGGLFLLCAFGMATVRQIQGCLTLYIGQSILLAISAFLMSSIYHSWDLFAVGCLNLIVKPGLIPWLLRRLMPTEIYNRREIVQALTIPISLLIALGLVFAAWFLSRPLLQVSDGALAATNLPIGLSCLFIGAFTIAVRREALPQFLGMLAMENAAFFAGIGIAPTLPFYAELAVAFDVLILTIVISVLTKTIKEQLGTTVVGELSSLTEIKKR